MATKAHNSLLPHQRVGDATISCHRALQSLLALAPTLARMSAWNMSRVYSPSRYGTTCMTEQHYQWSTKLQHPMPHKARASCPAASQALLRAHV